jgi:hypothetical protein
MTRWIVAFATSFLFAASLNADCSGARSPVRNAIDSDAALISASPMTTSIDTLRKFPPTRPLPQERRVKPIETTTYAVTATLTEYRRDENGDYHLVLSDEQGRTIGAVIPSAACVTGSRFTTQIAFARRTFESRFQATTAVQAAMVPIEVHGTGFFDFFSGERGAAPNGIALHPVTFLSFNPLFLPEPPAGRSGRRRAVAPGPVTPACSLPTLTLTPSKKGACAGESVVLTWQASDAAARVTIDGVGSSLPSSGSTTVSVSANTAYSGHATNACGSGNEAVAIVTLEAAATASLSGPASIQRGNIAPLSCFISGASSWALSSSLRNSIAPSIGTGTGNFSSSYTATNSGTDTVTLTASGGPCGSIMRMLTINVTVPTPPPASGLACCDGTRSPTCFSCSDKRGCCSGHGGVCGCS